MISGILLFVLAAGFPYYVFLEKSKRIGSKGIFLLSGLLLLCAIILSFFIENEHPTSLVVISFFSALYTIYRATKTTNFYKLGYYFIFINAPFFMLFEDKGAFYSLSLLVSLLGIYFIGRFYEKNYGSANYLAVRGVTLATPYLSIYITVYLLCIALYPPFPNSLFFLNYLFTGEPFRLWSIVVITLFTGNFFLAMRVMEKSLFGKPNLNIHYVDLTFKEKLLHLSVVTVLLGLSIYGLKELLL